MRMIQQKNRPKRFEIACSTIEKQLYLNKLNYFIKFARTSILLFCKITWLTLSGLSTFLCKLNLQTANDFCWISQLRKLLRHDNLKYYC